MLDPGEDLEAPLEVVALGIPGYADGRYPVEKLSTCQHLPTAFQHFAAPELGGIDFIERTFVVTVNPVNDAPTLDPIVNPVNPLPDPTNPALFVITDYYTSTRFKPEDW